MPKVVFNVQRMSPQEATARRFKNAVEWQMAAVGVPNKEKLGALLGVSAGTIRRWLRNPGRITLDDLWKLYRILNFSEEQKMILAEVKK